jgi:hypothetical protein
VSTPVTAPQRATTEPAGATPTSRNRRSLHSADLALAVVLAAGLALIVFVATGGSDLGPNTWVEIALLAGMAGTAVAVALLVPGKPGSGFATVALFAALAALSYLSIAWSVQPATSWVEANRTLAYLGVFAAAVALARLAPARWPAILGAIGLATVVVCGYALLAKVFPATLNANDTLGRLRVPFGYWNATGLMAALGLPVCLWAGTRPATGRILRSLSVPALTLLLTTLILAYSRGALLAAAIGLGTWFALVPLRLRATLLLAVGAIGAAIPTAWALAHHAITHDSVSLASRTAAGHTFGLVLLGVLALSTAGGFATIRAMDEVVLAEHTRRRIGTALLILVALVPVAAIAGAAASSRGLTGEISHDWGILTSTNGGVGNNPGRLAQLSNSRGLYWSEGLKVGEHAPLAGVGAGGFDTARTRYTTNSLAVAHAHSYLIETFADFGLIGIALSVALLTTWALATKRTLRRRPAEERHSDERRSAERIGLITMLAVVVTFGVSSLIDWTWFIPGVTVPALLCAGWLAGRGPLAASAPPRSATTHPASNPIAPARIAAAFGILAAALVAGWFVWRPLHSSDQVSAAIDALTRGDASAALADARSAANSNPVATEPLWELSAIYAALGDQTASRQELLHAVQVQPSNAQTWVQLSTFDLQAHRVGLARSELQTALRLDRTSAVTRQLIGQAQS